MINYTFKTDSDSEDFCEKIIQILKNKHGVSRDQAISHINMIWNGIDFLGVDKGNWRYHLSPERYAVDFARDIKKNG